MGGNKFEINKNTEAKLSLIHFAVQNWSQIDKNWNWKKKYIKFFVKIHNKCKKTAQKTGTKLPAQITILQKAFRLLQWTRNFKNVISWGTNLANKSRQTKIQNCQKRSIYKTSKNFQFPKYKIAEIFSIHKNLKVFWSQMHLSLRILPKLGRQKETDGR